MLSLADRVAIVIDGVVRAEGTHDELLRGDASYGAAVLRAQSEPAETADEKETTQ